MSVDFGVTRFVLLTPHLQARMADGGKTLDDVMTSINILYCGFFELFSEFT